MGDKKIIWEVASINSGNDILFDADPIDLLENTYMPSITIDSCSGWVELAAYGSDKFYNVVIGLSSPTSNVPFDAAGLALITNDEELENWLNTWKENIWMNIGGILKYAAGNEDTRRIEFDAKSKRSLRQGEKLMAVVFVRNRAAGAADSTIFTMDLTVFYH